MNEGINNDKPIIYSEENFKLLKDIPKLEDGQIYIYVMRNSAGNIKIGKTTNIQQRVKGLSGSNCGGEHITELYCSPATWLHSIEKTCHNRYDYARLSGEWFNGDKVNIGDVVCYVDGLFHTSGYDVCNELRRKRVMSKK